MKKFSEINVEGFDDEQPRNGLYDAYCVFNEADGLEFEVEFDEGFFYLQGRYQTRITEDNDELEFELNADDRITLEEMIEKKYGFRLF